MRYIVLLILLPIVAYGQDTSGATKKIPRFSLGLVVSPQYAYRTLENRDGSSSSNFIFDARNDFEIPKFGYNAGFSFCYNFSHRFALETGLLYSNKGYQIGGSSLIFGDLFDRRRGFVYNISGFPIDGKLIYSYHYLDVPVKLNVLTGKRKLRFLFTAGITANILLSAGVVFDGKDASGKRFRNKYTYTYSDYRPFCLSPVLGAGVSWLLSKRYELRAVPVFSYGIIPIIDAPITARLWCVGLDINLNYRL